MTRLQVETDDFVDASRSMFHEVAESMRICLDGVHLRAELVGTDPAGQQWAAAYDPAARSVLRATAQTIDAAYATARLLAQSGHNYAAAEAASTSSHSGVPDTTEWNQLLAPQPRARVPVSPGAGGAGGDTPTGWWLVEHTLGYLWPGGHQDRLHVTAHQWRSLAEGISHVTGDLLAIAARFAADHLPEADDIITVCTTLRTHTDTLLTGYTQLADACDTYADHLTDCHTAIVDELSDLLRDSAITQVAGAALAVFTLGGSEAAAQTSQATRIATAAARISTLIERLAHASQRVARTIAGIRNLADDITEALAALAGTRIAYAGVTQVKRAQGITRMIERSERALASAGRAEHLPSALRGRKLGDAGAWGDETTLAEHYGKHGREVGATSEHDYVRRASDFLQEAIAKGLPRKVDGKGNIRVWDPQTGLFGSYRADGSARTFFRPTSKTYFDRQPGDLQ